MLGPIFPSKSATSSSIKIMMKTVFVSCTYVSSCRLIERHIVIRASVFRRFGRARCRNTLTRGMVHI